VRTVGITTTVLAAGVLVLAGVVGAMSVPDIKRYLAMRRM
jgi:hypothetical protein